MATQPPVATAAGSSNNNDNNQAAPTDVQTLPDWILQRAEYDQRLVMYEMVTDQYHRICTCNWCMPQMYFNYPLSCYMWHNPDDIVVEPRGCPELKGRYEALSLVGQAINYFSRDRTDMDCTQLDSLDWCRTRLNQDRALDVTLPIPAEGVHSSQGLHELAERLNKLFFFGAINLASVKWDMIDDRPNELGWTTSSMRDGVVVSYIAVRPTGPKPLGTLLHELVHAFLKQYECHVCHLTVRDKVDHGRQWQRLAMAIELHSVELLEMEADLGRCDSMLDDRRKPKGKVQSIHDMQEWGFLLRWREAENRGETGVDDVATGPGLFGTD